MGKRSWTEEEEHLLWEMWPTRSNEEMVILLPLHSFLGIKNRAIKLGVKRKRIASYRKCISEELKNIPPTDAAYLAGIIDGEGYVSLRLDRKRFILDPCLGIANSDNRIIDYVKKWLPILTWLESPGRKGLGIVRSRRSVWRASVTGLIVGKVLEKIIPYMTVKRERAEAVMDFCEIALNREWWSKYTERQIQVFLFVRQENSRLGIKWFRSKEYRHLRRYLISQRAPGIL